MSRFCTWKGLSIAVGLVLLAGFVCIAMGRKDWASTLFTVAAVTGVIGSILVSAKSKGTSKQ